MKMKFKRTLESSGDTWDNVFDDLLAQAKAERTAQTKSTANTTSKMTPEPQSNPFCVPLGTIHIGLDLDKPKQTKKTNLGTVWSEISVDTSNIRKIRNNLRPRLEWLKDEKNI